MVNQRNTKMWLDMIRRGHIKKPLFSMPQNPPIKFFVKLYLLEDPKEIWDKRFFIDEKRSPISQFLRNPIIFPSTHTPILKLRDGENHLKPNLKRNFHDPRVLPQRCLETSSPLLTQYTLKQITTIVFSELVKGHYFTPRWNRM